MNGLWLSLFLAISPVNAIGATDNPAVHDDLNAIRRARYALRKTAENSPERLAAEKNLKEAKARLKEDRLKAKKK